MLSVSRLRPGLARKVGGSLSCSRATSEKWQPTVGCYLGDPESAIRGKTSWEIFRGWTVFKILSYDVVVDNSIKVSAPLYLAGYKLTPELSFTLIFTLGH